MMEWKDATYYAEDRRGIDPPTEWETSISGARIFLTCGHINYAGAWIMTCRDLDIVQKQIAPSGTPKGKAQSLAVGIAKKAVKEKLSKLQALSDALDADQ